MARYTVFGGRGFIGSEIVKRLEDSGQDVWVPRRDDKTIFKSELGIVIYSAGQGDCINEPIGVFEANCGLLAELLDKGKFERLIYISSTRVYMNDDSSSEYGDLRVCFDDRRRLFNLTKLVSEELCLKSKRNITIVRPSNVYGLALHSPLFLPSIIRDSINNGIVNMYIDHNYSKDYVSVNDVARVCVELSKIEDTLGKIINVASGFNISAAQIASTIEKNTGCRIEWHNVKTVDENFPVIDISLLRSYIHDYKPRHVLNDIESIINQFKASLMNINM
nr:dTDP-glucose-4,6-dehydratase [Plesiomonas shigelloides]